METNPRLCIVGGTGRNTGKTEFCCRLINRTAHQVQVVGLKVSAILPDEALLHGDHSEIETNLFEELRRDTNKDSSRMLRAGASQVFYLQGDKGTIASGYHKVLRLIPKDCLIICESNSLAAIVRPGLLVVIRSANRTAKPRSLPLLERADLIITSDGRSGFAELDHIGLDQHGFWQLQRPS